MMRTWTLLLIVAALAACTQQQNSSWTDGASAAPTQSQQAMDVAEVVFRYQFRHEAASARPDDVYFITLLRGDPSDEFLRRFFMHSPPVHAGSQFRPGAGLAFHIDAITFTNDDNVEVRGGFDDGLSTSTNDIYRVVRTDNQWVVAQDITR